MRKTGLNEKGKGGGKTVLYKLRVFYDNIPECTYSK